MNGGINLITENEDGTATRIAWFPEQDAGEVVAHLTAWLGPPRCEELIGRAEIEALAETRIAHLGAGLIIVHDTPDGEQQ